MDRTARAQSLELCGRDVAEAFVQARVVVPADVLDDRQLQLRACAPDAVGDQLSLEAVDEALGHCVVVGVADRPDERQDAVIGERLGV